MHKLAENHNIQSLQNFVCFSGKVEMMEKINGQTAKNSVVPDTTSNVQPILKTICRECKRTLLYL